MSVRYPAMRSEVRIHNGVPALFVDEEEASCHWCYCSPSHAGDFVRAGIRIFTFSLPGYRSKHRWWKAPDEYDFTFLYKRLSDFIKAAPDALFVPRIHMGLAEIEWFPDMFPEECNLAFRLDNGRPDVEYRHNRIGKPQHSMASRKWREIAGRALASIVKEAEDFCGDRILGYHVGGGFSAEWFTWHIVNRESIDDYSEPMRLAFREYVRAKYRDDKSLRRAWRHDAVTLETVEIPDVFRRGNPSLGAFYATVFEQDIIDYHECFGREDALSCIHLCRTVKEVVDWKKIVGVFGGYFLTFDRTLVPQRNGHLGFDKILDSDAIDFIASPYVYEYRGWGQNHHAQTIPITVQARGKLYIDEIDTRPHDTKFLFVWLENSLRPETVRQFCELLKRDFAYNQATGTAFWWMDLADDGWFSPQQVTETLIKLVRAEKRLKNVEKGSAAEIAVVLDRYSYAAQFPDPTHQEPYIAFLVQWEMPRIGAPFDVIFLEDFLAGEKDYRFALFPQMALLDEERAERLVEDLEARNISSMWFHAPGHSLPDENVQKIIGWKWKYGEKGHSNVTVRNAQHWLAEGIPEGTEYGATAGIEERRKNAFRWVLRDERAAHRIIIDDDGSSFVGALSDGEGVGLAVKEAGKTFSVLSSAPAPPSRMLRNAAKKAGVHLYAPHGDIVYAGKHFVGVSSAFDGTHKIELPAASQVVELESGEIIGGNVDAFEVDLKYGHCGIYGIFPVD